jgi:hypothetical protein
MFYNAVSVRGVVVRSAKSGSYFFIFNFANNNDLKHLIRSQLYIYYTLFKMVNQQKNW